MRRFWFMNSCIQRIQAESDLRMLTVSAMAQSSGDAAKNYHERLTLSIGDVYTFSDNFQRIEDLPNAKRDQAGFDDLKRMAAQKI